MPFIGVALSPVTVAPWVLAWPTSWCGLAVSRREGAEGEEERGIAAWCDLMPAATLSAMVAAVARWFLLRGGRVGKLVGGGPSGFCASACRRFLGRCEQGEVVLGGIDRFHVAGLARVAHSC